MNEELSLKQMMSLYEDGKHRRYSLLFSVNRGAFAVATFLFEHGDKPALGGLTLRKLSCVMVILTVILVTDIYAFGWKMRRYFLYSAFNLIGKGVLIFIGLIICWGWFLVGAR